MGKKNAALLRQLCCCVYVERGGVDKMTAPWRDMSSLRDLVGLRRTVTKRVGSKITLVCHNPKLGHRSVVVLSEEAVRDIFTRRPKDQYQVYVYVYIYECMYVCMCM